MTNMNNNKEALLHIIHCIPSGKVATYGQIASMAGLGKAARLVGNTLRNLPADTGIPWHRVINAQGKISLPLNSEGYRTQKQRLESEAIQFDGERINLRIYGWQ